MQNNKLDLSEKQVSYSWRPQPGPQTAFIHTPGDIFEVGYGGSRGGGKTDAALGKLLIMAEKYGKHFTGIFFRRELTQLEGVIARSKEIYGLHGAEYNEAKKIWKFPNGARIMMRFIDKDSEEEKYRGWNVQVIVFEELTNFPSPKPYHKLKGILRSSHGVPCQMISTFNPGGPGHSWVKKYFIDPAPDGYKPIINTYTIKDSKTGKLVTKESKRVFIPAKLTDNKLLTENDPEYEARLAQSGSEQLVEAWLHGRWDIVDGAFFTEFDPRKHVIKQVDLPDHWLRFRAMDWGSAKPFAVYWIAVASEGWTSPRDGRFIPKDALVVYREWYGIQHDKNGDFMPNTGVRMFAEHVGAGIVEREQLDPPISYGVIDPAAFAKDGGPSIEERLRRGAGALKGRMRVNGHIWRRADNKRVPGRGALGGWDTVRARLVGEELTKGREPVPMLYFMDSCIHIIRTLPELQHNENHIEDVDTEGEDHGPDAIRYGCMVRYYVRPTPSTKKPIQLLSDLTMNDIMNSREDSTQINNWRI